MTDIHCYCDAVAAAFKPQRIILFGSHAYGKVTEDSDVDVLVVMPGSRCKRTDIAIQIRLRIPAEFSVDVLVRSASETARRLRDGDLFMTQIFSQGRVMFDALHA